MLGIKRKGVPVVEIIKKTFKIIGQTIGIIIFLPFLIGGLAICAIGAYWAFINPNLFATTALAGYPFSLRLILGSICLGVLVEFIYVFFQKSINQFVHAHTFIYRIILFAFGFLIGIAIPSLTLMDFGLGVIFGLADAAGDAASTSRVGNTVYKGIRTDAMVELFVFGFILLIVCFGWLLMYHALTAKREELKK